MIRIGSCSFEFRDSNDVGYVLPLDVATGHLGVLALSVTELTAWME